MGMDDNNSCLRELPWRLCGADMEKRYRGDQRTENASEPKGSDLWTGIPSIVNTSSGAEMGVDVNKTYQGLQNQVPPGATVASRLVYGNRELSLSPGTIYP